MYIDGFVRPVGLVNMADVLRRADGRKIKVPPNSQVLIGIRCRQSTKVEFKRFAAGFHTYEEALLKAMELAKQHIDWGR